MILLEAALAPCPKVMPATHKLALVTSNRLPNIGPMPPRMRAPLFDEELERPNPPTCQRLLLEPLPWPMEIPPEVVLNTPPLLITRLLPTLPAPFAARVRLLTFVTTPPLITTALPVDAPLAPTAKAEFTMSQYVLANTVNVLLLPVTPMVPVLLQRRALVTVIVFQEPK